MYDGPGLEPNEVAQLRIGTPTVSLSVLRIDDRRASGQSWELLPGEHVVEAEIQMGYGKNSGGWNLSSSARTICVAAFVAEPGRQYLLEGGQMKRAGDSANVARQVGMWIADPEAPEVPLGQWECA